MNKFYYLPFVPTANIDYLYLFSFYDLAEFDNNLRVYNRIYYKSAKLLSQRLKLSVSTINRIFSNTDYNNFLTIDKKQKLIIINNYFPKNVSAKFVRLTADEVLLIRDINSNLFAKYLIYVKYYCGYTKNNTDFTAKQFLQSFNYSINSGKYISLISEYNRILVDKKIISIEEYKDELGHTRNRYSYIKCDSI